MFFSDPDHRQPVHWWVKTGKRPADPKKLATVKATFLEKTGHYLPCVRELTIPMANNKAERAIRLLVIKRKLLRVDTHKGADVMSILLSVCLTT